MTGEPPHGSVLAWIRARRPPNGLRRLLASGAGRAEVDQNGDTPMHLAAASSDRRYLDRLLDAGFDPDLINAVTGRSPIVTAMIWERRPQVRALLAAGVDLTRADRTGNTPLHVAAQINDPAFVLQLLEHGAPALARNDQGQTFQPYLFMTPDRLLTRAARDDRRAVERWLRQHAIARERSPAL